MRKLILLLAILSILIVSCTQNQNAPGPGPFIGGTEGLVMNFGIGAPPDEISDANTWPFSITTIIENVGEADIRPGDAVVRVVGIDPYQFDVTENDLIVEIEDPIRGAAKLYDGTEVPGDVVSTFMPKNDRTMIYLPNLQGTDEILLRAELCYEYMTKSTTQICIKDQVLDNINNDKICEVSGPKIARNSGAPLHVTNVRQFPQGKNNIQVTFTIEHVGTGLFFRPGVTDRKGLLYCDDSVSNLDENWVDVEVYLSGEGGYQAGGVRCSLFNNDNSGSINMYQGGGQQISCTIQGDPGKDRIFQDILHIDLNYNYLTFIEKPIIIRDITTEEDFEI